ncbi:carbohydrate ABC transporter substrate-binding protein [Amycolatopsis sp. K13G38]|uniref:Carbohydrate ABC transporter substrate-binding protein n=1 Tax=Amycolatopsis acididurans TaxID=2724524 RepID=A0ABX1JEG9_9PSEU|nr:carbohydrate ABC transporter substrate-binding protein [Amycolatopsis acididurans]NKQ56896.1 carbohydrate ABC transporter substrate-binding protein [Amycolatopsis acididurans]
MLRGLTWDHPRGYAPLDALSLPVRWDRQSLEGFESAPIAGLAADYDLMIIDHPGLGDAVAAGSLLPFEELLAPEELASWRSSSAGASFDSYTVDGRQWALPIDAATQVAVTTLPEAPRTWAQARQVDTALCLGGPHALLTFWSICLAHGATPPEVPRPVGVLALELMAELRGREQWWRLNPIGLLEAMASGAGPAYCPVVYGYVGYADRLTFADTPTVHGRHGSVLGGTGLAVSALRDVNRAQAARVARALISPRVQREVFVAAGGQPADAEVWRTNGFHADTLSTMEDAWVRPRRQGYIKFQTEASALLRENLGAMPPHRLLAELENLGRNG